jgi:CXXC-20-CXXC protein
VIVDHPCPHCGYPIKADELRDKNQPLMRNYRFCPHCTVRLTVDRKTRIRQIVLLILSSILLIIFFFPYYEAKMIAAIGLILILIYLFYADKKLEFVEIENQRSEIENND